MCDLISRQAAIDALDKRFDSIPMEQTTEILLLRRDLRNLPSAQPELSEITDEQAILHLQSTGWMQNHDKEMYEMGLREQLADDNRDYDSLIPCEDAISRQAAISAVGYCQTYLFDSRDEDKKISLEDAEYAIAQLPSAQPEPCEDAVSREAVSYAVNTIKLKDADTPYKFYREVLKRLCELPSVTPKPKTGIWKERSDSDFDCSECGWISDAKYDYCPNCGSFNMEVFAK